MFDEFIPYEVRAYISVAFILLFVLFGTLAFMLPTKPISPLAQAYMDFYDKMEIGDVVPQHNGYLCIANDLYFEFNSDWILIVGSWEHIKRKEMKLIRRKANEVCTRILTQKVNGGKFYGADNLPGGKFECGDLVMVCSKRPEPIGFWVVPMDYTLGKVCRIHSFTARTGNCVSDNGWAYDPTWLTLIKRKENKNV